MKCTAVLITGFMVVLSCSEMEIAWTQKIDIAGAGMYRIADVVRIDNQVYCVGTFSPDTSSTCCFVAAFDSNDVLMWHALYQDPDGDAVEGRSLVVRRANNELFDNTYTVFVHAQTTRADSTRGSLLLDYQEGTLAWSKELDLETGEDEQQSMMLSDHAEGLYMIGLKQTPVHEKVLFINQYNIEGRFLQERQIYTINTDHVVAAIADPYNIVISGVDEWNHQIFYMRYQELDPGIDPVRISCNGNDPLISDVRITRSGNVYILGAVRQEDNGYDYVTMCYSDKDSLVWTRTFDGYDGYDDLPVVMDLDDSLYAYVTGTTATETGKTDILTVKYDPAGNELWSRCFIGKKDESLQPYFLLPGDPHSSGSFYIYGTAGNNVLLVKYNKSGFLRWFTRIQHGDAVCVPTAWASHVIALEAADGAKREALLVKIQRAEQFGLNRWD
ncbi:hypothetical protein JXB22_09450 [candidate division WOR-3 bacterium]|nr:hypothetical protein [candidate division WOR-3 bacterium]